MLVIVWWIKDIIALGDTTDKGLEVWCWSVVPHGGGAILSPQGQLAIGGDIFSCHNWGKGFPWQRVLIKVKPWDHFMLFISCIRRMLWVASNRKQTETGSNIIISPHWESRRRSGDSDADPCQWGPRFPPFLHSIHSQFFLRLSHGCQQLLGQPAFVHV